MKVLDVDLFQEGLQRNITMLDRLSSETEAIHRSVEGLVQMEDQLKGAGGNSIRSFYEECHIPFLHFFQLFSEHFKQVLHQMEAALHSLEPDSSGCILEQFLEGELEQGLTFIGQLTASLTDETNSIMDQVSDVVGLPHLDDSGVQEGVIQSKRKRDDTVMQLHEFDASQTTALNPIEQDLQTMDTWLRDIEGLFQAGISDITFEQSQWNVLTFRSEIRTELFPKVYLNPSNLWIEEREKMIGTMITAATFQTLEGKKVNSIEENVEENIKYHEYDNGLLIKEYVVGQTIFYEVVSKVEYKEETVQADLPKKSNGLDHFQTVLDIAGLIPGFGEIADGVNGLIYSARGDATNAALSFGAMIPFVGWASTGGKFAKKGSDLYEARNVLSTEKVESIYSPIYQDVVNSPLGRTQYQLDILYNIQSQLGTPKALMLNLSTAKTEIPTTIKSGDADVKNEIKNVDIETKGIDNASVTNKSNLYRGDSLLHSSTRPNGIGKPHISSSGDLVPASKNGLYKGRQVTVTEHILGGYRKGAKSNSPYTSFTNNKNVIGNYGENAIEIDISALRKDIQSGKVKDVVILSPKQIQKLIERDVVSSDFWKNRAINWTKRDNEYLIKGEVPSQYIKVSPKE